MKMQGLKESQLPASKSAQSQGMMEYPPKCYCPGEIPVLLKRDVRDLRDLTLSSVHPEKRSVSAEDNVPNASKVIQSSRP